MRFFIFWLIRFGGAAIGFLLGVLVSLSLSTGMVDVMISDPRTVADLAAASPEQLREYLLNLVLMGSIDGVLTAVLTWVGYRLSRRLALRWTGVVLAGEADAVVHPAVVHVEALSPEVRKNWVDVHPSQTSYGTAVLLLLVASGAVVTYVFGHLTGSGELVAIGFMSGITAYSSIAVLGGLVNRKLRRRVGMPAEYLAQAMFRRDAGL
jgi:hypothetical protein